MIGQVINNYRITERIGAGGMGEVYKAEHTLIGRSAAVKVLLPDYSGNKELVQRFFNEARAASAIHHPGIVEILDFGYHGQGAYILMEFLDGETLKQRMRRLHVMPVDMAMHFTRQIAGALAAAHDKGIVHRDLKPDNIYMIADPEVAGGERIKLLDFGIAKLADEHISGVKTRTGLVMGTPSYMAPEQCKGAGRVDHRADLYSLGCIVFHMLCGRPPFVAEGGGEVMAQQIYAQPARPTTLMPVLPPAMDDFVLSLLAKEPDMRPQSARDVISRLDALSGGGAVTRMATDGGFGQRLPSVGPVQTTLGASAVSRPVEPEPGRRGWVVPVAAVATVLLGLGGYLLLRGDSPRAPVAAAGVDEPVIEASAAVVEPDLPVAGAVGQGPGELQAQADDIEDIEVVEPELVRVIIESEPRGAELYRGEERLGLTPYPVEVPAGEEREYVLKRKGYRDHAVRVPGDAGGGGEVAVKLEREPRVRSTAGASSTSSTSGASSKSGASEASGKSSEGGGKTRKKPREDTLRKGGSLPL